MQCQLFQRNHAADADGPVSLRCGIEGVGFRVRLGTGRISPRDALGDQPLGAGRDGSGYDGATFPLAPSDPVSYLSTPLSLSISFCWISPLC